LSSQKKWPCFFFKTDTTGEKDFEEFYTDAENVDWDRYSELGVVQNEAFAKKEQLESFEQRIVGMKESKTWSKIELLDAFSLLLPDFAHKETGKTLDNRM